MKSSKIFLKFFCVFLILTFIQSKNSNSKKIFLQTKQEEETSSINLSCYLDSKEKTEPNGCFFDTPENLLKIIKQKLETYSEKCDLTNKEDVGQLYDIARGLGVLAGELYSDPSYKPTEEELANLQKEILSINFNVPDSSHIQYKDIENAFVNTLREKWLDYTKTKDYPQFYVNNSLSLAAYAYAYNFLSNGYSNKTQCIEVNAANKAVLFIISKDINEEETPLINKDISSIIKLEKEGFDYGGYALAFWVKQDTQELETPKKLLTAFVNNTEALSLKVKKCQNNNVLAIGDQKFNIHTTPKCAEYSFVLLAFLKDCDAYRVKYIIRDSYSNERYNITTEDLDTNLIENLQIKINSDNVLNPHFYTHFKYSESKENQIFVDTYKKLYSMVENSVEKCSQSDPNCRYTTDEGECIVCEKGYLMNGGKCVENCPDNTFKLDDYSCSNCSDTCQTCDNSKSCLTCKEGLNFYNGECLEVCVNGTYAVDGKCESCGDDCQTCISEHKCGTCLPGTYEYKGKCYKECPKGSYLDLVELKCSECKTGCSECISYEVCTDCENDYYLFDEKKCVKECPVGFRKNLDTKLCEKCLDNCKFCTNDTNVCEECNDGFSLRNDNTCGGCPEGQVSFKKICIDCADKENCILCSSINTKECEKCVENKVLLPNATCGNNCDEGFYLSDDRACTKCVVENCKTCSKTQCNYCKDGFVLFNFTKCVTECPNGYINIDGVCAKCNNDLCKKCSDDLSTCTKCYTPEYVLKEGECVTECGEKYFQSGEICKNCGDGCKDCINEYTCANCLDNYYNKDGKCVTDCGDGLRENKKTGKCESCKVNNCKNCPKDADVCSQCIEGKVLYNNECYDNCPSGSYLPSKTVEETVGESGDKCESCPLNCVKCTDGETCVKCNSNYVLQDTVCQIECNDNYYNDNGVCTKCENPNCLRCSVQDSEKCESCPSNKLFYDNNCVDECPDGTYQSEGRCLKCDATCRTCEESATNCLSCVKGLVYQPNKEEKCVNECDKGSVPVDGVCKDCTQKNCEICKTDNLDYCITPEPQNFTISGKVVEQCPDGTFIESDRHCDYCKENCKVCENTNSCNECYNGYYLKGNECVDQCGNGYVTDESNKKCIPCSSSCTQCKLEDTQCCSSCPVSQFLLNCDCLDKCPEKYWTDYENSLCKSCNDVNCNICTNKGETCVKCSNGYVLNSEGTKCIPLPCPDGTLEVDGQCQKCLVDNCKNCPISTNVCGLCEKEKILVNEYKCGDSCPEGEYKELVKNKEGYYYCEKCADSNCLLCNDGKSCEKCNNGKVLYNNKCIDTCPNGYYADENGRCVECSFEHCKTCNKDNCFDCKGDYKLLEKKNKCYEECPKGYYADDNDVCQECSLNCEECSDAKTCTKCEEPYLIGTDNLCTDECEEGSVNIDGRCNICKTGDNCVKCDVDLITCTKCFGDYVLQDNECVHECKDGFYDQDGICKKCIDNCYRCTNGKQCNECNIGYVLYNDECVDVCPDGFYKGDKKCIKCPEGCTICSNADTCTSCEEGKKLEENKCVNQCSMGYYEFSKTECKKCDDNCVNCQGTKNCLLCANGYNILKGECVEKCPENMLPVNGICTKCTDKCKVCGDNIETCVECEENFFLNDGKCVNPCPVGLTDKDGKCESCPEYCKICIFDFKKAEADLFIQLKDKGDPDCPLPNCEECEEGYSYMNTTNRCLEKCPNGYSSFNGICEVCTGLNCKTCEIDPNVCTECPFNFYLYQGSCVEECPKGTYKSDKLCLPCAPDCEKCKDGEYCTSCNDGTYLNDGRCTNECDKNEVVVDGECKACEKEHCSICNPEKLDECITCEKGYYYLDNECVENCGDNYYKDVNSGKCVHCNNGACKECNNAEVCQKCYDGYVNQNGLCQEVCNEKYVERNGECVKCSDDNCLICNNVKLDTCKKCNLPYKLFGEKCVKNCDEGYFAADYINYQVCEKCKDNCQSCDNKNSCNRCVSPYVLLNNECISSCPEGYVNVNGECKACSQEGCLQCSPYDQTICSKCRSDLYLAVNNQCTSDCGTGFYPSPEGFCVKCGDENCKECSPSNNCKKCYGEKVVFDGKCLDECPSGYYANDYKCLPCEDKENCKSCYILNSEKCKECSKGFLYEYKCVEECPDGYYPDNENKVCVKCQGGCAKCKDSKVCYDCESGLYLDEFDHTCKDKCPSGQVGVTGKCRNCDDYKNCVQCSNDNLKNCVQCNPAFYNYNGKCVNECPSGTFAKGMVCEDCESNCKKCLDETTCIDCNSDKVEFNNDCLDNCYNNYVNVNGHCTQCSQSNCDVCTPENLNVCVKCKEGYLNDNGNCVLTCGPYRYYNYNEMKCSECLPGCINCDNNNSCKNCDNGLYLYLNNACIDSCPDTYYANTLTNKCEKCTGVTCKTCSSTNPNICLTCPEGELLITYENGLNECVTSCPPTYYQNNEKGTCDKCDFPCKECVENSNYCLNCESPYKFIENTCVSNCPEHTTEREGICYNCVDEHCLACDSYELSKCNSCDEETVIFNGECLKECPEHYYLKTTENGVKTCGKCEENCDKCSDSVNCEKCMNNYYFAEGTKSCVSCESPNLIIGEQCVTCKAKGCNVCVEGQPNICAICDDKLSLYEGECYSDCPTGFFKNGNICEQCEPNCLTCSGIGQCTKCQENLVLFNGQCIGECPEGFRNNDGKCEKCSDENCLSCTTSPEICDKCKTLIYEQKCYDKCPEGTFIYGNTCNKCSENCLKCDSTQCSSCAKGLYIFEDKCVEKCGDGYYAKDDKICIPCSQPNCKVCEEDKCTVPKDGFYIEDDNVVPKCKDGNYGNEQTRHCEPCAEGCALCTSQTDCLNCIESYSFYEGVCVNPCPEKFTSVGKKCVPCTQEKCLTCAPHDPQTCIDCSNYLYNGVCVENCPEGTFVDNNNNCLPCDSKCKVCTDQNNCLKCKSEFVLDGSLCLNKCEDGKVSINGECVGCESEKCKVCSSNIKECLECFTPYVSYKGECIDKCPIGTYQDTEKNTCVNCDASCDDCTNKDTCVQCRSGYYMLNGKCLVNCPEGYYEDCAATSRKCVKCNNACKTCVLEKASDCIECADGYFLYNKECISTLNCPTGTFFDNGNNTCVKCNINYCAECSSLNQCKRCNRGYNLENGECNKATTITNIIGDYMLVSESYDKFKSQRPPQQTSFKDNKGTGIGANDVTLSFYLRSLTPELKKDMEVIDVINDKKSGYSFKFIIDKDDNKCKLKIYDYDSDKNYNTIEICDCKYRNIYDWKFFAISLGKDDEDFVARVNTIDDENRIKEETVKLDNNNHNSVIEPSAYIVLSPNNGTNYHIGKLNVMDYYPTDEQLKSISKYLPSNCDYFCTSCQDNCKSCPNGLLPIDNRCKANYINEEPILNSKQELFEVPLNEALDGNLVSDAYGYTQWFYVENINKNEENVLSVDVNGLDYIRLTIKNGMLYFNDKKLDYTGIKEGSWYFLLISLLKNNVTVMIQDENKNRFTQKIDDFTFIRHYNDFVYNLHDNDAKSIGGSLNSKIYINNLPSEEDIEIDIQELKCTENCEKCDEALKCTQCAEGFTVSNGICEENSAKEDEFTQLLNIKDYWNKDTDVLEVPYDNNLTLTFNLRKKTHSNFYSDGNKFNIIGFKTDPTSEVKSLVKEEIPADFQSKYSVFNEENNFVHDYTEEIPDLLSFIYIVNTYDNSVTAFINDFSVGKQYTFNFNLKDNDKVKYIVVGDRNGVEMNYEVTNVKVYDGVARGELLEKLKEYPKVCSGICTDCDYSVGLCNVCSYDSAPSSPHECRNKVYRWYPANIFNIFDWNSLKTGDYIMYLNRYESVGINSEVSSFYFRFRMFKLIDGSKYRITCFSNDETKIFNPKENRGNSYLCMDVNVRNNMATLDLIINDGEKVTISVPNFTFKKGEYVRGVAVINIKDKVFKYAFRKIGQNEDASAGEYNYKHTPERLQESGGISLYGVDDEDVDKNVYSIPHIYIDMIGVIPNFADYMSLFAKFEAGLPHTEPVCHEGCDACVWNSKFTSGICYECLAGYNPVNNNMNSNEVTCQRQNDKINLFKGSLVQGDAEFKISDTSIFNGNFALYFQLIYNFAFFDYQVSNSILELGKLNIVALNNKLYVVVNNKDSAEIPIIDIYRKWNNIMLAVSGNTLKITVKAGAKTNTATLSSSNLKMIPSNTIKLNSLGYSTTFGAVAVSTNIDINHVRQDDPTGYDECGPNCAYCENGKCKVCGAGNSDKNDADCDDGKKQFISEYYDSADADGLITYKDLFTPGNYERFIRMKKWTLQTNLEFDKIIPDKNEVNFFKFLNFNGIDSITCNINMNTGIVNIYLYPSETIQKGDEPEQVTLKLPEKIKSPYFFFAMAYENEKFRAIFAETETNFASVEHTMSAFLGAFGPESTFEYHNDGVNSNIGLKITHTTFFYNYAKTLKDLENNLKKRVKKIQQDCSVGTISICNECSTGFIKNGLCFPPDVKAGYTALISEYAQINKYYYEKYGSVQLGNLKEFTLSFTYRMVNLLSDTQNLIKIVYGNNLNLITLYYFPPNDKFYVMLGDNKWISNTVFSTDNDNPFDYVQVAISYSITSGNGNLYVKSLSGKTILSQTISAKEANEIYGNPKYTIYYGFRAGNTLSGSFEIGGIEVFDYAMKKSEINNFIFNGLIETKVGCKQLVGGSCISPLSDEETDFTRRVYQKDSNSYPLFNNLLTTAVNKYYSFNKYVISFELNAELFYSGRYTANQNYLFAITDYVNNKILSYPKTTSFSVDNMILAKSFSLYLSGTSFAIKTPTLPWSTSGQQTFTINFGASSFKENIIVSFFGDAENNKLSMLLTYKSTSYFYDLELDTEQRVPLIGFASLVYGHPALKNFNINFNSVDFVNNFYDGFAKSVPNSCISGNGNSYCPNCPAKFRLFQAVCYTTRIESLN